MKDQTDISNPSQSEERIKKILNRFQNALSSYSQGKVNQFFINEPSIVLLTKIKQILAARLIKSEKMPIGLQLIHSSIPLRQIKGMFDPLPSIELTVTDGSRIRSKGIMFTIGEYFIEDNEKQIDTTSSFMESYYAGETINNIRTGRCQFISHDRQNDFWYEGQFVNGFFHGKGQKRTQKHLFYNGDFKNDLKEGHGVQIQLKKKKGSVKGEYSFFQIFKYQGYFKQDKRDGLGTEDNQQYTYTGGWKEGMKSGKGQIIYKSEDYYDGQWENDVFNGQGEYLSKGTLKYKGNFANGKYQGEGCMIYYNGDNGAQGDKYQGNFRKGKKHGKGVYTWKNGDFYDGDWKNNNASGSGQSMMSCEFYNGQFQNGMRHGQGDWTNQDGDIISSRWQDNIKVEDLMINGQPVQQQ